MTNDKKFKSGDVVQLKSGGPTMTVSEMGLYGLVWVNFFDLDGKFRSVAIKPETLEIVVKE